MVSHHQICIILLGRLLLQSLYSDLMWISVLLKSSLLFFPNLYFFTLKKTRKVTIFNCYPSKFILSVFWTTKSLKSSFTLLLYYSVKFECWNNVWMINIEILWGNIETKNEVPIINIQSAVVLILYQKL